MVILSVRPQATGTTKGKGGRRHTTTGHLAPPPNCCLPKLAYRTAAHTTYTLTGVEIVAVVLLRS